MKIKKQVEFNDIISDILKNEEIIGLRYEYHHGISRLDHSLNVARLTFNMCKLFKIEKIEELQELLYFMNFYKTGEDSSFRGHPTTAVNNAKRVFNVNDMQADIIYNHMFPATLRVPKYKETWIVTTADKLVAINECTRYKLPIQIGTVFLFLFNFMMIQR